MKSMQNEIKRQLLKGGIVDPKLIVRDDEVFIRMTVEERLQHITLIACFVLLVITGLPLLFDPTVWLQRAFFF